MVHATPPAAPSDRAARLVGIPHTHGMPWTTLFERQPGNANSVSHPDTDADPDPVA
jgi:hypothetical protein